MCVRLHKYVYVCLCYCRCTVEVIICGCSVKILIRRQDKNKCDLQLLGKSYCIMSCNNNVCEFSVDSVSFSV